MFYGEDNNVTATFGSKSPDVPPGYNFDFVNADALEHKLSVKNGTLVTGSGMQYRVLMLDPYSVHMSLPVLRRLQTLVHDGATVIGKRPLDSPSLADDKAEFKTIADDVWGTSEGDRSVGKGRVLQQGSVSEALLRAQISPDVTFAKTTPQTNILYVHRRTPTADLYYIDNQSNQTATLETSFRTTGKAAELWHADTGKVEAASYTISNGRTSIPMTLEPFGTVFVVFRYPAKTPSRKLPTVREADVLTLDGSWDLRFEESKGAPASVTLDRLTSWAESEDHGIKYFSGHAAYTKHIHLLASAFKAGQRMWIDLGTVANLAEVTLNGKSLGIAWKSPYRVDATGALHPGDNLLQVRVVNLWVNRLIGDQHPNARQYTFTARNPYKATSPLLPAGLLGPVRITREERVPEGNIRQ